MWHIANSQDGVGGILVGKFMWCYHRVPSVKSGERFHQMTRCMLVLDYKSLQSDRKHDLLIG